MSQYYLEHSGSSKMLTPSFPVFSNSFKWLNSSIMWDWTLIPTFQPHARESSWFHNGYEWHGSTYQEFPPQETQARESCGLKILAHLEFILESYRCWEEIWEVHFIGRLSIALPNTVVRKPSLTFWPHVGSSPTKRVSLRLFSVRVVSGSFSI